MISRFPVAIALVVAFVTPAAAQMQTTCTPGLGGAVYCNTSRGMQIPGPPAASQVRTIDPVAALQEGERLRQMRLQNELMQQQNEVQREQMAQARDAAAAEPQRHQRWSKEGATQDGFMKDRFECIRAAMAPNGQVVADVAFACLEARGYRKDPNGLGPPDEAPQ